MDHLALARIGSSLPLEVPIDGAALHKIAPRSTRRADDDFVLSEGVFRNTIRLFYKNLGQKKLMVDAVGKEACFAIIQGAVQTRHGSGDAHVIYRRSGT